MDDYITVAKVSDLEPGQHRRVEVESKRVLLANVEGTFYALKDECGHQKAALSKGKLDGHAVECPLHFARFDLRNGKMLSGPDFARLKIPGLDLSLPEAQKAMEQMGSILSDVETEAVPSYEVKVKGDEVQIRL